MGDVIDIDTLQACYPPTKPTQITREQFIRGVRAIQSYHAMVRAVGEVMAAAGCDPPEDLGGGELVVELRQQLMERCSDVVTDPFGTQIAYMLYDAGRAWTHDGREWDLSTPEGLWAWWHATRNGPFTP